MLKSIIIYSGISGITVFIGGAIANYFNSHFKESVRKNEIIHTFMSFGAGIILSALALVLIPTGLEGLNLVEFILSFLTGTLIFMFINKSLEKKGGKTATLLAMLMDFIPESIALGAVFATDTSMALLLAIFIGLQNLPEAFNSFRDMVKSGFTVKKTLLIFFIISFFGIISALLGHFLLANSPYITNHLMTFASGGILYLLFQDIIPESKLEKNYLTSLGASIGFLVGVIGEKII
jgi:ZIP family zinc transporter